MKTKTNEEGDSTTKLSQGISSGGCCKLDWPNWAVPIIAVILGAVIGHYLNVEPGLDYRTDPPELVLKGGAPEKEIKLTIMNSHWYPRFNKQIALKVWVDGGEIPKGLSIMLSREEAPSLEDGFISFMTLRADRNLNGTEYDINYKLIGDNSNDKGVLRLKIV